MYKGNRFHVLHCMKFKELVIISHSILHPLIFLLIFAMTYFLSIYNHKLNPELNEEFNNKKVENALFLRSIDKGNKQYSNLKVSASFICTFFFSILYISHHQRKTNVCLKLVYFTTQMVTNSIHSVMKDNISFFFYSSLYSIMYIYHIFLIQSSGMHTLVDSIHHYCELNCLKNEVYK